MMKRIRPIYVALALIGIAILAKSPDIAQNLADQYATRLGGSVATAQYLAMLDAYGTTYQLLGSVLAGVGLFRAFR